MKKTLTVLKKHFEKQNKNIKLILVINIGNYVPSLLALYYLPIQFIHLCIHPKNI